MPSVEERVETPETVLKEAIRALTASHIQTEREFREFKEEMLDFKNEMLTFKGEMVVFKNETKEDTVKFYKQLGDIANKQGTIVEDMVAPNIPTIAHEYFQCADLYFFGLRITKKNSKDKSKSREFDIIAATDDTLIVNETKSTPKIEYINEFIEVLKDVYDYFPEHKGKKIIPVFSSLYIPENVVSYLTRMKLYAMAIKDDTMDLLNYNSFVLI